MYIDMASLAFRRVIMLHGVQEAKLETDSKSPTINDGKLQVYLWDLICFPGWTLDIPCKCTKSTLPLQHHTEVFIAGTFDSLIII